MIYQRIMLLSRETLEKLTDKKLVKGNFKGVYKVLHMVRNRSMHLHILESNQLESRFAEEDLRVVAVIKLTMSQ